MQPFGHQIRRLQLLIPGAAASRTRDSLENNEPRINTNRQGWTQIFRIATPSVSIRVHPWLVRSHFHARWRPGRQGALL